MIRSLDEALNRSSLIVVLSALALMLLRLEPADAAPTNLAPVPEFVFDTQFVQLPEIVLEVDPKGQFDSKIGTATISGTVSCSSPTFVIISGDLEQSVHGHLSVSQGFEGSVYCEGEGETPWTFIVEPDNGFFKGGNLTATVLAYWCTDDEGGECTGDSVQTNIQLSGGK